jgi:hypothetical protein
MCVVRVSGLLSILYCVCVCGVWKDGRGWDVQIISGRVDDSRCMTY